MRVIKLFIQSIVVATVLSACAHVEDKNISAEDVSAAQTWGQAEKVTQLKHLYFSDQPDAEALKIAKDNGVVAVINLRGPKEMKWDEKKATEELGMSYYNIPLMTSSPSFDSEVVAQIEAAVAEQGHAPVLLHCSSSNRVGAWLAIHLADKHKIEKEEALAIAKKAGMTKQPLVDRVRLYWGQ